MYLRIFLSLTAVLCFISVHARILDADSIPRTENDLDSAAYYGYQGWHYAPGDGRTVRNDWVHWFNKGIPYAVNIHGDMWPDMSEYDPANLYTTDLKYANGETAKVYSCFDYSTIDLHIKWMKDYGIKGCVVQRFSNHIDKELDLLPSMNEGVSCPFW